MPWQPPWPHGCCSEIQTGATPWARAFWLASYCLSQFVQENRSGHDVGPTSQLCAPPLQIEGPATSAGPRVFAGGLRLAAVPAVPPPTGGRRASARHDRRSRTRVSCGHGSHSCTHSPTSHRPSPISQPSRLPLEPTGVSHAENPVSEGDSALWVTSMMVLPSRCRSFRICISWAPVSLSRLPVGSSARKSAGSFSSALAMVLSWSETIQAPPVIPSNIRYAIAHLPTVGVPDRGVHSVVDKRGHHRRSVRKVPPSGLPPSRRTVRSTGGHHEATATRTRSAMRSRGSVRRVPAGGNSLSCTVHLP